MTQRLNRQGGLTIIELVMFIVITGVAAASIMQVMNLATKNSTDPIRRKQAMLIAEAYMEEVQQAHFTFCDGADANASTATSPALDATGIDPTKCASAVEDFGPENGNTRPYDNINDYIPKPALASDPPLVNTPARSFAVTKGGNLVDTDVAGNALGVNGSGNQLGNSAMSGITTTVMLNADPNLGPGGSTIPSTVNAASLNVLRITITTTYGTGPNDSITLDGYRTRYAPTYTP